MLSKAIYTSLQTGCKADWYIHDNVDKCIEEWKIKNPRKNDILAKGWFAEIGDYNKMADFNWNAWEGGIVSGPYLTREEAIKAAEEEIKNRDNK